MRRVCQHREREGETNVDCGLWGVVVIAWGLVVVGVCGGSVVYTSMCVCVGVVCLFDTHCQARAIKTARCIFICIIKLSCNANLALPFPLLPALLHCSNLTRFYPRSIPSTLFTILYPSPNSTFSGFKPLSVLSATFRSYHAAKLLLACCFCLQLSESIYTSLPPSLPPSLVLALAVVIV